MQKSCRELLQGGNRKRRLKIHFFADYQNFRTVTLIPLALAGIDARAPFFSRRIRWTPPSFPWHNRVSAWLSLRVRASDYGWCPNIDRFLYAHVHTHTCTRTHTHICTHTHACTCTHTHTQLFSVNPSSSLDLIFVYPAIISAHSTYTVV